MSALPKHEPEPAAAEQDAEGWALLEALRRRLDDQGALGRKTQHQVTQLAESIGALVAEQRRRAKWANLNSFVAYVLFTVLVGAAFFVLYRSRAHDLVDARDTAAKERDTAIKRADDLAQKQASRESADAKAWEIYQLLDGGKRADAQAKLAALGDAPLSRTEKAVLAARAHETAVMEVDAALKGAAGSFKAGRYAEVVAPLEAALVTEPTGARSTTMKYYLGVAYAKAGDLDKSVPLLSAAVAGDVEQEDARFQLASALDRAGQYAKARAEYDRFSTAHPQSGLAVFAMRRSATLARMPAVAPARGAVTTPPTATTPGAKAAAPTAPPPAKPAAPTAPPKPAAPAKPAPTDLPVLQKPASTNPAGEPSAQSMSTAIDVARIDAATVTNGDGLLAFDSAPKAEPPKAEPPRAEPPKPADKPKTEAPKLPPVSRADPTLPGFGIDKTPPQDPLGPPPVEREPAPAPREVPRQDPGPGLPPIRF